MDYFLLINLFIKRSSMAENIGIYKKNLPIVKYFWLFITWWYIEVPISILKMAKTPFILISDFFSIPILLRTFFQPWHRDYIPLSTRQSLQDIGRILALNLISRFFGMIIRAFFIIFGLILEILAFCSVVFFFILWLVFPILSILGIFYGIILLS